MALPSFLGNFILGTGCVPGKNLLDSGRHFILVPEIPDRYNVIGPLWPIFIMPSLAQDSISQGGLYYVYYKRLPRWSQYEI